MKLLMTKDLKLSAVETNKDFLKEELEGLEVTHTAKSMFENIGKQQIDFPTPKTLKESIEAFDKIKQNILEQGVSVKNFDIKTIQKLKRARASDLIQKAVYEVDKSENFDAILKSLKEAKHGALYRAIKSDKEHNLITVYSTRFGAWNTLQDGFQIKMNEAGSQNLLRLNCADRQMTDITKLQDVSRQNYPVRNDLRPLFKKGLIQEFTKDDYKILAIHFKEELSEEDMKQFENNKEVKKEITKETSHTSKTNANSQEVAKAILNNEKEIHSTAEVQIDEVEKFESRRTQNVEQFAEKLQNDLKIQQEREFLKLQEKIKMAKNERKVAKEEAIKLLANGMNIDEAINELSAKKYNDITIQFVTEDLKTEIISSINKEAELKTVKKELEKTTKKADSLEEKNKKNYENYVEQLRLKKTAEENAEKLAIKLQKASIVLHENKKIINAQNIANADLTEENISLKEELKTSEEVVESIEKELESSSKKIYSLTNVVEKKKEEIEIIEAEIIEKDEEIKQKTEENISLKEEVSEVKNSLLDLMKKNDEANHLITDLKQINSKMREENFEMAQALKNLKNIEAEFAEFRKNLDIQQKTEEKIEKVEETLKDGESEETFDEMMKKIDDLMDDKPQAKKHFEEDENE